MVVEMISITLILLFFTILTILKLVDYERNYLYYCWYDIALIIFLWIAFVIQVAGLIAIVFIELGWWK